MRRPILALVLCALGGCGSGYTIDYLGPKSRILGNGLDRFGLDEAQSGCIAESLTSSLSVAQLRQLAQVARAASVGIEEEAPLSVRELVAASSHVGDPEVADEVARAVGSCSLSAQTRESQAGAEALDPEAPEAEEAEAQAEESAAQPAQPPVPGGKVENGPPNYRPTEALLAALEAYDRGDFSAAATMAERAAEQGDSGAQQFLGGLYAFGRGVPVDHQQAALYYRLAAERGWSEAMNNLGKAYELGEGVPKDPVRALKWYLLSYNRATEDAGLVAANMTRLLKRMTDEQIKQAQALELEWEQAHPR